MRTAQTRKTTKKLQKFKLCFILLTWDVREGKIPFIVYNTCVRRIELIYDFFTSRQYTD